MECDEGKCEMVGRRLLKLTIRPRNTSRARTVGGDRKAGMLGRERGRGRGIQTVNRTRCSPSRPDGRFTALLEAKHAQTRARPRRSSAHGARSSKSLACAKFALPVSSPAASAVYSSCTLPLNIRATGCGVVLHFLSMIRPLCMFKVSSLKSLLRACSCLLVT